ncbi:MAG TPA: cytochrome c oxidase subunit II [Anaerolineae bacterium]|nr:cytochrome c oxidase subunit II [Anaerolineae bacterium]
MGMIENISTFGAEVDALYFVVLIVTGVAFFLVEGILIYFLIRYRHREGNRAMYTHGNRRVEILWTIVPGILLFGLAVYQYGAWTQIKIDLPDESEAVVMQVMSNQFEWFASYPGPDGQFETDDDIEAPINIIHVPINQPVIIRLGSVDVLHSFFVPVLRLKQDAIPGTIIRIWFEATKAGEYEIVCTELCGLGHYRMRGRLIVESETDFQTWLAEMAAR